MKFQTTEQAQTHWKQLDTLYSSPERHYHNWWHIYEFVQQLDSLSLLEEEARCYLQACFYHDAIYNAGAKQNEEESLELWKSHIQSTIHHSDNEGANLVSDLILSTKHHQPSAVPYSAEFIDCDLAPLAYNGTKYAEYVCQIRAEYAVFNDEQWKFGRGKFLEHCLAQNQGRIFWSQDVAAEQIQVAVANLQAELDKFSC